MPAPDFEANREDVGPEVDYVLLLGGEFTREDNGRWWVRPRTHPRQRRTWHWKCNAARDWLLREHAFQVVDGELVRDEQYAACIALQRTS
jgi:hypothetical protein